MIVISEFYSDSKEKRAIVYNDGGHPFVSFLVEDAVINCKSFKGKTFRYAEDAAENFVEGIMKLEDVLDPPRED